MAFEDISRKKINELSDRSIIAEKEESGEVDEEEMVEENLFEDLEIGPEQSEVIAQRVTDEIWETVEHDSRVNHFYGYMVADYIEDLLDQMAERAVADDFQAEKLVSYSERTVGDSIKGDVMINGQKIPYSLKPEGYEFALNLKKEELGTVFKKALPGILAELKK